MPALEYPAPETIALWDLRSRGVRDGSYPTQTFEFDSVTLRGRVFCKWQYRYDVVNWLVGDAATYVDGSTTRLSRLLPVAPDPERPRVVVTKVTSMTGHVFEEDDPDVTTGLPLPTYTDAEIEFLAEFVPFELLDDDEVTEDERQRFVSYLDEVEPSGEFLQLPSAAGLVYLSDNPAVNNKPVPTNQFAIVVPQEMFTVTWHRLPEDAWEPGAYLWDRVYGTAEWDPTGMPLMGCINSAAFFGRPVGTVLLQRARPRRRVKQTGTGFQWDITFECLYRPAGWNYLYRWDPDPANRGYYFVGPRDGTVYGADVVPDFYSLYNSRNLNELFAVGV